MRYEGGSEPDHILKSIQFAAGEVEEQEEEFGPQD